MSEAWWNAGEMSLISGSFFNKDGWREVMRCWASNFIIISNESTIWSLLIVPSRKPGVAMASTPCDIFQLPSEEYWWGSYIEILIASSTVSYRRAFGTPEDEIAHRNSVRDSLIVKSAYLQQLTMLSTSVMCIIDDNFFWEASFNGVMPSAKVKHILRITAIFESTREQPSGRMTGLHVWRSTSDNTIA